MATGVKLAKISDVHRRYEIIELLLRYLFAICKLQGVEI